MDDSYAIATDKYIQSVTDKVSNDIANALSSKIDKKSLSDVNTLLGVSIARIMKNSYDTALHEINNGQIGRAQQRSYALPGGFTARVSDFYARYVPILSSNLSARSFLGIQDLIKRLDAKGLSTNEIKDEVGYHFANMRGNGNIIIRTEGTRASSLARRAYAQKAAEVGRGPDIYIYKALMDNATTQTCQAMNNVYWRFDDDDVRYWPSRHFNCRAGVVYGWFDDIDKNLRRLTPQLLVGLTEIQNKEFPSWRQMDDLDLVNPSSALKVNRSGSAKIADNTALEYASRQMDKLRASDGISVRTPEANSVKSMIEDTARMAGRPNIELRNRIVRELTGEVSKGAELIDEIRERQKKRR